MATQKPQSAPQKNLSETPPSEDEVLQQVYAERDAYAAEHNYDLDRIFIDLTRRAERTHLGQTDSGSVASSGR